MAEKSELFGFGARSVDVSSQPGDMQGYERGRSESMQRKFATTFASLLLE